MIVQWKILQAVVRRLLNHVLLVVVIAGGIGVSRLAPALSPAGADLPRTAAGTRAPAVGRPGLMTLAPGNAMPVAGEDVLVAAANIHTTIPDRPRRDIITYTVQADDTPISIAAQFGLDPSTILWGNPGLGDNPETLQIGEVLNILPVDGALHVVAEGDTLDSIAGAYGVDPQVITGYQENAIPREGPLQAGAQVIVPGGQREYVVWTVPVPPAAASASSGQTSPTAGTYYAGAPSVQGIGTYIWPLSGPITQGFWTGHRAVDISAVTGTPIIASDSGTVVFAGWSTAGYGYLIVLDHGNGAQTYYAHQSAFAVDLGQAVSQGQVVGYVGSTGRSTGPHLHFEIRYGGVQLNPFDYLP